MSSFRITDLYPDLVDILGTDQQPVSASNSTLGSANAMACPLQLADPWDYDSPCLQTTVASALSANPLVTGRRHPTTLSPGEKTLLRSELGLMTDIGVREARCLVDIGADVSVIGRDALDRLQLPLQDFEGGQHPTITQADQSAIEFIGVVRCALYLAGTVIPHVFYVSNDKAFQAPQYDVILGNDILKRLGVLMIDYGKKTIKLRDVDNKAEFVFEMQGCKCILITEGASSCWHMVGPPPVISGNSSRIQTTLG